jgi:hypothetical protein
MKGSWIGYTDESSKRKPKNVICFREIRFLKILNRDQVQLLSSRGLSARAGQHATPFR